ncbi:hypothetical protein [Alkalihalobacterium alkalinitrilicum]|uniref:hypothetical protein n=1 Tax=Alkalihalobacterium alkalinitrilicum TaxID=427920 RepID=UPI000994C33A|nr:hypothetical protein [Alkalihalobacterium alkalinitrilicum]
MSQKAKQKNETNVTETFVETFWDQFEVALSRISKENDERSDAYLDAVKQMNKFSGDYRKTIRGLYQETRSTNDELVKGISSSISEKLKREPSQHSQELYKQWRDITNKFEEISLTPLNQTFDMIERIEKRVEQNTEDYIKYSRNRRKAWSSVSNEYIQILREQNKQAVGRIEDSFRTFLRTGTNN